MPDRNPVVISQHILIIIINALLWVKPKKCIMREATIKRIDILQAAIFSAAMTFFISLIFVVPMFWFMSSMAPMMSGETAMGFKMFSGGMLFILPFIYGFFGFIYGALSALIFNLVARVVGGIKIKFETADRHDRSMEGLQDLGA